MKNEIETSDKESTGNEGEPAQEARTFSALCKELGSRTNATENALLCHSAYTAFRAERKAGDTKADSVRSFRKEAAREAGLSPSTIDALLQIGKAIAPLPAETQLALKGSPLGNMTRLLRKLARDEHDENRLADVTEYLAGYGSDPKTARAVLEKKLGCGPKRTALEARELHAETAHLAEDEYVEHAFGRGYLVRVEMHGTTGGRTRIRLTISQSERKEIDTFLPTPASGIPAPIATLPVHSIGQPELQHAVGE